MMWRFFVHHRDTPPVSYPSDIDRQNYELCRKMWDRLSTRERDIMTLIHTTKRPDLGDAVHTFAAEKHMPEQLVWHVSFRIARETGVMRGLITDKRNRAERTADNRKPS